MAVTLGLALKLGLGVRVSDMVTVTVTVSVGVGGGQGAPISSTLSEVQLKVVHVGRAHRMEVAPSELAGP